MMLRWFPWKQLISWFARSRGFVDPVTLLSRLEGFGQPLDVKAPLELIRAGVLFHSRGLLNTGAIQHNLDWIWPYWVERQYDPHDDAFIPRSFSITHINLTNRNWTAVGIPGLDELPIVDPRGLVTPFWDSWSIDAWIVTERGERLYPSRLQSVEQHLDMHDGVTVVTSCSAKGMRLSSRVAAEIRDGLPMCTINLSSHSSDPGWLVVSLRPYNPEGVSFINDIRVLETGPGWNVDKGTNVTFSRSPDHYRFSFYRQGDVKNTLFNVPEQKRVHCRVGMATAAALFRIDGNETRLQSAVSLARKKHYDKGRLSGGWPHSLMGAAALKAPDPLFQYLYEAALRSLILHSPGDIYPGPFTYKRFWFRDATFAMHAMLVAGLIKRVGRILDSFPGRQKANGFFHSQEGEWDSNGEVLWIFQRFCELSGEAPRSHWRDAIDRGARWIIRKRLPADTGMPFSGLLPAGFSAEHLGPNDYYFWDDFWGVAGLRSAASCLDSLHEPAAALRYRNEADNFLGCIETSLQGVRQRLERQGMPASPYRRMDPGAIGSLAAGYPLQLFAADDPRLLDTVNFLLDKCTHNGGFFQDVIHSGINAYLTLHMAQVLLRAGDSRCLELFRTVAQLASPTGQWPEAIHPRTLGGCMGDGQHVWASAEWVLMQRNCFVREENGRLILGAGLFPDWLSQPLPFSFGPTPTPFGPITIEVTPENKKINVAWHAQWRDAAPEILVCLPGFSPLAVRADSYSALVPRENSS
jgi:hypothetical protein